MAQLINTITTRPTLSAARTIGRTRSAATRSTTRSSGASSARSRSGSNTGRGCARSGARGSAGRRLREYPRLTGNCSVSVIPPIMARFTLFENDGVAFAARVEAVRRQGLLAQARHDKIEVERFFKKRGKSCVLRIHLDCGVKNIWGVLAPAALHFASDVIEASVKVMA